MFFTIRYTRALNELGINKGVLTQTQQNALFEYGEVMRKEKVTPQQAALGAFVNFYESKVILRDPMVFALGNFAQAQFIQWVQQGKIREEDLSWASEKITSALASIQ